jgi:hypothetical protein
VQSLTKQEKTETRNYGNSNIRFYRSSTFVQS